MQSSASLGAAIAISRLSPEVRHHFDARGGVEGFAQTLDAVQEHYASPCEQMVGFVMYTQQFLDIHPQLWSHWLPTAWTMAAKSVFDDGIYVADTLTVWNSEEVRAIFGEQSLKNAIACEACAFEANMCGLGFNSIMTRLHTFRSAMVRVILQETNVLPLLRAPVAAHGTLLRVLLVQPDEYIAAQMCDTLRSSVLDLRIDVALNGNEAVSMARLHGYDILYVDLELPSPDEIGGAVLPPNSMAVGMHRTALAHAIRHKVELLLGDSMCDLSVAYDNSSGTPLVVGCTQHTLKETDIDTLCTSTNDRDERAFDAVFSLPFTLSVAHATLGMCWGVA
jgi:hypothetical protein